MVEPNESLVGQVVGQWTLGGTCSGVYGGIDGEFGERGVTNGGCSGAEEVVYKMVQKEVVVGHVMGRR